MDLTYEGWVGVYHIPPALNRYKCKQAVLDMVIKNRAPQNA